MTGEIWFRWLGVGGIELRVNDRILAVDPFFTRPPFRRLWFGRVQSDSKLVADKIPKCNFVLVTHAHWDHLMDVPEVVTNTGATAFGSPNVCRLLAAFGVPGEQIREIGTGDHLSLGEFRVEVLPAMHQKTPIDRLINGPLTKDLKPPLRLLDYRMDACFGFMICVDQIRLLCGEHPVPADVVFPIPRRGPAYLETLVRGVRPRCVVPIHWDDLFRPLSKPLRAMYYQPAWAVPPFQKMDPAMFKRTIEAMAPGITVLIPERFQPYLLNPLFRE